MYNVFLLTRPGDGMMAMVSQVDQSGLSCRVGIDLVELEDAAQTAPVDVVLLDHAAVGIGARSVIERISDLHLPTLSIIDRVALERYDPGVKADDFILAPLDGTELLARVSQIMFRRTETANTQIIRVGELFIDLQSYEVSMAGQRVSLTYKEFQLLSLLASNPGRVYSREALLNQVWGYDYLGGTRTVDVHIRRLRSKIEDPDRHFVETIWNVGYRFRDFSGDN